MNLKLISTKYLPMLMISLFGRILYHVSVEINYTLFIYISLFFEIL